jgi:predicted CXXCH cytochrome family protein
MARPHDRTGAHPLDVHYAEAQARRPGLRPPAALAGELVLVDGKVACTTCHDPRSLEHGRTALPMSRSAMCFACHDL